VAELFVSESDLREVLRERAAVLPPTANRVESVLARVRRRRRRVGIAAVGAVAAVGLVAVSSMLLSHATSAPASGGNVYPRVYAGGTLVHQFSGNGPAIASAIVAWPPADRIGTTGNCQNAAGAVLQISVNGASTSVACTQGPWLVTGPWTNAFAGLRAGQRVQLSISLSGAVGQWSFALLKMDPHWTESTTGRSHGPIPARNGSSVDLGFFPNDDNFIYTARSTHPAFTIECSQAGRMSLVIGGRVLGTAMCPDSTWAAVPFTVPPGSFESIGWRPGAVVTVTLHWSGARFVPYRLDLSEN